MNCVNGIIILVESTALKLASTLKVSAMPRFSLKVDIFMIFFKQILKRSAAIKHQPMPDMQEKFL